jgi:hypothetical protein
MVTPNMGFAASKLGVERFFPIQANGIQYLGAQLFAESAWQICGTVQIPWRGITWRDLSAGRVFG